MTATTEPRSIYLDASAAVKLIKPEAESTALQAWLRPWARRVSSELLTVELLTFSDRNGLPRSDGEALLGSLRLIPFTAQTISDGLQAFNPPLRALDALHLGAALRARKVLAYLVTYDQQQSAAAVRAGLPAASPS